MHAQYIATRTCATQYVHVYMHMYICMRIYTCTFRCYMLYMLYIYPYIYMYMYGHMYMNIYTCTCICTYVGMFFYVALCACHSASRNIKKETQRLLCLNEIFRILIRLKACFLGGPNPLSPLSSGPSKPTYAAAALTQLVDLALSTCQT